jgi:acetyl-CoA C-acetyltransferase
LALEGEVVILAAARTPIGKYGSALRDFSAPQLGKIAIEEVLRRAGVAAGEVEEVIMGNVVSAGLGQNPARQAAIFAGVPYEAGAFTVNKVCGSGLKAVMLAAQAIKCGDFAVLVAGGMESMSNAPYLLRKARFGYRLGDGTLIDAMVYDGLWDVYNDFHMGITGEIIAEKYGLKREEVDEFALRSHRLALAAIDDGKFAEEIVPVEARGSVVDVDEGPRRDTSLEKLAKLKPVFKKGGLVTAGNASQLSDGAAAVLVCSREFADEHDKKPLARVLGYCTAGVAPKYVMEAPIRGVRALLEKTGFSLSEIDFVEHNEAFAAASVVVQRELAIPDEKFNVRGGAVALGHPIGASGARVLVTLLHALRQEHKRYGIATLCLGGGNAVSMLVESLR